MTYIMIVLILLSGFCFVKSFFSKRILILTIMLWSLIGMVFSLFFLISITSNYTTVGYIFGSFDRNMFINIVKNRLSYFTIIRIFNICTSSYLLTMSLFALSYIQKKSSSGYLKKVLSVVKISIFPVMYLIFYDPKSVLIQYILTMQHDSFFTLLCISDLILHATVYAYMLFPFYQLYMSKDSIYSIYKKRQLIGVSLYLVITDIIYIFITKMSSLKTLYVTIKPAQLISVQTSGAFSKEYLIYIILLLFSIIILFYISSSFNIIRKEGFFYDRITEKLIQKNQKQVMQTFHGFKNIIYSYSLTLNRIKQAEGKERDELTEKLSRDMNSYIEHLTTVINLGKGIKDFWAEKVYLSDVIDEAVDKLGNVDNIEIIKDYVPKIELIAADSFYLTEAIYNIIQNAVQAIEETEQDDGRITLSIKQEFEWIVLCVTDNGTGMTKKQMRNIFKEFYTTKTRITNWGVGLSFSKRILKYHHGNISVKSKPGAGTTFYILLPDYADVSLKI